MDTRMSDPSVEIEALVAGTLMWRVGRLGRGLAEEQDWHSTWKVIGCCRRIGRKKIRIVAGEGRLVVLDAFDHLWDMAPYDYGIPGWRLRRATAILWTDMAVASHADEMFDAMLKFPRVFGCVMLY